MRREQVEKRPNLGRTAKALAHILQLLSETIKQFAGVAVRMGPAAHYFRFDSHFASGPAQNIIFPNWFAGRALHGQTVFAKVRSSRALARMAAFSAAPVCIRVRSSRPFGCNRYIGSPQAAACGEKTLL